MIQQEEESMTLEDARQRYSAHLTKNEQKAFDDVDKDFFIEAEAYLASLQTEEGLLSELVRQWNYYFQQNEIYEAYCAAQRVNDKATITRLEREYPPGDGKKGIAELYADWGDIHDGRTFDEWIAERRHLFFPPEKKVVQINQPVDTVADSMVLVAIPKGLDDDQWYRLFRDFWKKHYGPAYASYAPKYQINGNISIDAVRRLEIAILVDDLLLYNDPEEKKKKDREYSHTQVAKTITFNPLLRYKFGLGDEWKPTEIQENSAKKGTLGLTEFERKKSYMVKLEKDYQSCVDNTIYGIFPSKSS